jgi:hypothetical protein
MNKPEVVMQKMTLYKHTLAQVYQFVQSRSQSIRENFGDDPADEMNQRDWPVVLQRGCLS